MMLNQRLNRNVATTAIAQELACFMCGAADRSYRIMDMIFR